VGGYLSSTESEIHAFEFDFSAGALRACGSFSGISNPAYLALHRTNPWWCSVSDAGHKDANSFGKVWSSSYERAPFVIRALNYKSTSGRSPCHL